MTTFTRHTLFARDPLRAASFYRDLLGWTIDDEGRCTDGGRVVATIERSGAPPHVPSYWLAFLAVKDLETVIEQARSLGARVRVHAAGVEAIG